MDLEVVPHFAFDLTIGVALGQDGFQSRRNRVGSVRKNSGRVGRGKEEIVLMRHKKSHILRGLIQRLKIVCRHF